MNKKIYLLFIFGALFMLACKKQKEPVTSIQYDSSVFKKLDYSYSDRKPAVFPPQSPINDNLIILGRVLFYDKNLSRNNSISCGSCHKQEFGFADRVRFHKGILGNTLTRNTLSITGDANVMFWDGRTFNLNSLILLPIQNHDEMFSNLQELPQKLSNLEYYDDLFTNAFGSNEITLEKISNAITAFCKCINNKRSRFLMYLKNKAVLSPEEKSGMEIFIGKGRCSQCHSVFNDTTNLVYQVSGFHNIGLDIQPEDIGRFAISEEPMDYGAFKIPNLMNVELTPPYMHDGRFQTLEEVVDFYDHGIQFSSSLSFFLRNIDMVALEDKVDSLFKKGILISDFEDLDQYIPEFNQPARLGLSYQEKQNLISFLKTLTDRDIVKDPRFSNPFKYNK